jgi:hypothetical protein
MRHKTEAILAAIATILTLYTALVNPWMAMAFASASIVGMAIYFYFARYIFRD